MLFSAASDTQRSITSLYTTALASLQEALPVNEGGSASHRKPFVGCGCGVEPAPPLNLVESV